MRILLIGGNGFIGRFVMAALQEQGHSIALFQRGTNAAPAGVEQIQGDRSQLSSSAIGTEALCSQGGDRPGYQLQAEELMNVFRSAARRVIMLSSMDAIVR